MANMKRFLLLCASILISSMAFSQTVLISTADYPPYTIENQDNPGVIIELVLAAFHTQGIQTQLVFRPWPRGEESTRQGTVFGTAPYFKTPERSVDFDFSDPILLSRNNFYYSRAKHPDGLNWETLSDFKGYVLGGVRGYWYLESFSEAGLTVDIVTTDLQNIQKLIAGRVDFIVMDPVTLNQKVNENFPEYKGSILPLEKPESETAFHLMVSRDYPDSTSYLRQLNTGLSRIQETGEYYQILEKYSIPRSLAVED